MLAELVGVERLAGVTYLVDDAGISNVPSHYPRRIPRHRRQSEALLALEPDLVIVSSHTNAVAVRVLLRAGVAVVRIADANSFAEIADILDTLVFDRGRACKGAADGAGPAPAAHRGQLAGGSGGGLRRHRLYA